MERGRFVLTIWDSTRCKRFRFNWTCARCLTAWEKAFNTDTRYLNGLRIDIAAWAQDAHDFLSQPNRDEVITTFLDLMNTPNHAWIQEFHAKWYE